MNRLTQFFEEEEEPQLADEYFVIETPQYWFAVSRETAHSIERLLDRWWGPRWITFIDIYGARRRILRSAVDFISESTPSLRAAGRAFRRARKLEEKADHRSWEDDD